MDKNTIIEELNNNISRLEDIDTYMNIISYNSGLIRYDIINKLIIKLCYNTDVIDARTEEEWFSSGREIINKKKHMDIIIPMYSTEYIDTVTKEKVDVTEFTPWEYKKALELNVIESQRNLVDSKVAAIYDIRNTKNIESDNKFDIRKPKVSVGLLIEIMKKQFGFRIKKADTLNIKLDKRIIELPMMEYSDTVSVLIDTLMDALNIEDKMLNNSIKYAMYSLFEIEDKSIMTSILSDFSILEYDEILAYISEVDKFMYVITSYVEFTDNSISDDVTHNIMVIKKASTLLDMMLANKLQSLISGI